LSEGLGHAFMALTDGATVVYLCSAPYAPGREHGIDPLDPAIGIAWPLDSAPVLSEKDRIAPSLERALHDGLLPRHETCTTYAATPRSASAATLCPLRRPPLLLGRRPRSPYATLRSPARSASRVRTRKSRLTRHIPTFPRTDGAADSPASATVRRREHVCREF